MSTLSKYVFDPIKDVLKTISGTDNALTQLGSAQAQVDAALQMIVKTAVGAVMNLLPVGAGLKIEVLTDVIAGLQSELSDIQTASISNIQGNTSQAKAGGVLPV